MDKHTVMNQTKFGYRIERIRSIKTVAKASILTVAMASALVSYAGQPGRPNVGQAIFQSQVQAWRDTGGVMHGMAQSTGAYVRQTAYGVQHPIYTAREVIRTGVQFGEHPIQGVQQVARGLAGDLRAYNQAVDQHRYTDAGRMIGNVMVPIAAAEFGGAAFKSATLPRSIINPHTIEMHGMETSISQLEQRAQTGMRPNGTAGNSVTATRFINNEAMQNTLQRGHVALRQGTYQLQANGRRVVTVDQGQVVGEGIWKNQDRTTGHFVTTQATVVYAPDGTIVTAFPGVSPQVRNAAYQLGH